MEAVSWGTIVVPIIVAAILFGTLAVVMHIGQGRPHA